MKQLQRVLHVDDAEDIRIIAEIALKTIGKFDLLQCDSGMQAVKKAQAFAPDLFLLDFMMPEMNGRETLNALRALPDLQEVPVVFMTARVGEDFSNELRREGALEVIAKPFDPMELANQLRGLWQAHHSG